MFRNMPMTCSETTKQIHASRCIGTHGDSVFKYCVYLTDILMKV